MLIWKVIDANPGITRDEIFAKIEHEIPAGWAKRRYLALKINSVPQSHGTELILRRARRYVLMDILSAMKKKRSIEQGSDGGYRKLRPLKWYKGDAGKVDETGTIAADHLNVAYAWRTLRAAVKRVNPKHPTLTQAEWHALVKVVEAEGRPVP